MRDARAAATRSSSGLPAPLEETMRWWLESAEVLATDVVERAARAGVLRHAGRDCLELWHASLHANLALMAMMMLKREHPDDLTLPPQTVEYAQTLLRREVPVDAALDAGRYALPIVWDQVTGRLLEASADRSGPLMRQWSNHYFAYCNAWFEAYGQLYADERRRWENTTHALTRETVNSLLRGSQLDPHMISQRLGYELQRTQIAFIAATDGARSADGYLDTLHTTVFAVAEALGSARPLVVHEGEREVWAWVHPKAGRDEGWVEASVVAPGVTVALGTPRNGVSGFRSSHFEAREARRVADLSAPRPVLSRYRDVELASLMSSDVPRARAFVREHLGALGADDRRTEELRRTLLTYLECGSNRLEAASRLGVHQNTVTNRLHRIEETLGRRIDDLRLLELQASLILARHIGVDRPTGRRNAPW